MPPTIANPTLPTFQQQTDSSWFAKQRELGPLLTPTENDDRCREMAELSLGPAIAVMAPRSRMFWKFEEGKGTLSWQISWRYPQSVVLV